MIDSHCHLNLDPLTLDVAGALERAAAAGVGRVVVPGVDIESSEEGIRLAGLHDTVFAAVGVHPCHSWEAGTEEALIGLLERNPMIRAVGEIGLDYFHLADSPEKVAQEANFRTQILLAQRFAKPIIIHCREAFADTYAILTEMAAGYPVVIHCCTATADEAEQWLALGYHLSFTGIITYPKNADLRAVTAATPWERMLLETDAPYLAPQKFRGHSCEPAFVAEVAACIAEARGCSLEDVDRRTTAATEKFFHLK